MSILSRSTNAALLSALFARLAAAHEHHDDKIPEGEGISPDPIVRLLDLFENSAEQTAGYNIMDPHPDTDRCVRAHISYGYGARRESPQENRQASFEYTVLIQNLSIDCPLSMACPSTDIWCHYVYSWLFPRSRTQRPSIFTQHSCHLRHVPLDNARCSGGFWDLSQVTP